MQKLRRIFIPFIILAAFGVIFFILYRQTATLDKGEDLTREVSSPDTETIPKDRPFSSRVDQTVRVNRNIHVHGTTDPPIADFATDPI